MRTIRHYIDMRAAKEPDKIYLYAPEPNLTLTYAQLQHDSIELGKSLLCWATDTRPPNFF